MPNERKKSKLASLRKKAPVLLDRPDSAAGFAVSVLFYGWFFLYFYNLLYNYFHVLVPGLYVQLAKPGSELINLILFPTLGLVGFLPSIVIYQIIASIDMAIVEKIKGKSD